MTYWNHWNHLTYWNESLDLLELLDLLESPESLELLESLESRDLLEPQKTSITDLLVSHASFVPRNISPNNFVRYLGNVFQIQILMGDIGRHCHRSC